MQIQSLKLPNLSKTPFKGSKKEDLSCGDTKMQSDTFCASEKHFDVNLSRRFENVIYPSFYECRGYINGRMLNTKVDYTAKVLFFRDYYAIGTLGDDKVALKADIKGVRGKVGDKEVDLHYHKPFSSTKQSFSGTIGDKEINIANGDSLEAAKGEEDILALAFFLEGNEVSMDNGRLKLKGEDFSGIMRS